MVEVGGALGPSFEAQAVNLSEEGMHLRTAYLPETGQPITCRFDAGQGMVVVAAGEVLWTDDMGDGGEFGIRFTNLDSASTVALQRIVGMVEDGMTLRPPQGRKVRLHIEGLASPMRARVKGAQGPSVTAFSELGFLQVGKQLDLEDAATGSKRPALIDKVAVEVEQDTRIPQLIVTLRYDDEEARAGGAMEVDMAETGRDGMGEHGDHEGHDAHDQAGEHAHAGHEQAHDGMDDDDVAPPRGHEHDHGDAHLSARMSASATDEVPEGETSKPMKGALARSAAKVTPALEKWAKRAKTTMAVLAARAIAKKGGKGDDVEIPVRRTTAPAPGGGLHTAGRKVIRGDAPDRPTHAMPDDDKPRFPINKKKMIVAGSIGAATILAFVAFRKPAPAPSATTVMPPDTISASAPPVGGPVTGAAPVAPAPVNDPLASAALGAAGMGPVDPSNPADKGHHGRATPFGMGTVTRGNVLKIKMDGPVEKIQGASQPAGFTVVIPGRKALDSASALAAKDPRIAAIRMANENGGAELTVTFKDGVPNYQVKARGDTLEMHLARPNRGSDKAPEAHKKHGKKHH